MRGTADPPASTPTWPPRGEARRLLRPAALPSDTFVRFLLLLLAVCAAGLYLFQSLWFTLRGDRFLAEVQRCGVVAGELAGGLVGTTAAELRRQAECRAGVSQEQAAFAALGTVVVLATAWAAYRLRPGWHERRSRLTPLDPEDGEAVLAEVDRLAEQAGLAAAPQVRVDASGAGHASAYGSARDPRLALGGGLVVQQVLDPPAFRAVVRHELAHVANRDVPWTWYTWAVWWAFVGLALVPVAAVLATSDVAHVLRLGGRGAVLALLVALVAAGVLRARELFADARAAEWGSGDDLARLLAAAPPPSGRRPAALRLHPTPAERRALLADTGPLFRASAATAFAAGLAAGTAQSALQWVLGLVVPPDAGVALSALAVAPVVAVLLCTSAWRCSLRELARGEREPSGLPLGLGLGAGLATAPLLTFEAAAAPVATGTLGWAGYAAWSAGGVAAALLLARWVADTARVSAAGALRLATPRPALLRQTAVATLLVTLLLVLAAQSLPFLTTGGPWAVVALPFWLALGTVAVPVAGALAPAAALVLAGAVPLAARRDLARPLLPGAGTWAWCPEAIAVTSRPAPPPSTGPARSPELLAPGAGRAADPLRAPGPPAVRPVVAVAAVSGAVAAASVLAGRLLVALVDAPARGTDALALAVGQVVQGSVVAAVVVAAVAGVLVVPARWWPLALLGAAAAGTVAGLGATLVVVAGNCGLLPTLAPDCEVPGPGLVELAVLEPVARGATPAFALAATLGLAGAARACRRRGARPAPARRPPASGAGAAVPAFRPPADVPRQGGWQPPRSRRPDGRPHRAARVALGAAVAVGVWAGTLAAGVLRVEVPVVAGQGFAVHTPAGWSGRVDPATGWGSFVTVAQDLHVVIAPGLPPAPAADGEALLVGGRSAHPVGTAREGSVERAAYQVVRPDGGTLTLLVTATDRHRDRREGELRSLLQAVVWEE